MLEIHGLRFQHHSSARPALRGIDLAVESGMFLAVVGPSGSGKSTLLRAINGLVPHFHGGQFGGRVLINGQDTRRTSTADLSRSVGFAGQDPETQTVFDTVVDDIAFGPENLGFNRTKIHEHVQCALGDMGIDHLCERDISTLSGGERQRVVIAGTLAMGSRILVLDEPLSQLDPWGAEELLQTLDGLRQHQGVSIVVAEHRLDNLLRYCTHVLELQSGTSVNGLLRTRTALRLLDARPALVQLAETLNWPELPLGVADARELHIRHGPVLPDQPENEFYPGITRISASEITVSAGDAMILDGVTMAVSEASVTVFMGRNGSGKTTLLRALAGLQAIDSGSVTIEDHAVSVLSNRDRPSAIGFVPQHPASLFLGQSVREEVETSTSGTGTPGRADAILRQFRLEHLAEHYSYDISGGERQRLAIAIATAATPRVLILDEPTRGMDQDARDELGAHLNELREAGTAVVLSTHDSELAARVADRVLLLDHGSVSLVGSPAFVFSNEPALMTDTGLTLGPGYLTVESVAREVGRLCRLRVPPRSGTAIFGADTGA
ncbi:MAG: ATP-binding cassette domain-containing protein [Thermomicrobiaceae bacterium]